MDQTEQNLFLLLACTVLEMKGAIECGGKYLRRYEDGGSTYGITNLGKNLKSYSEAEPCVFTLIHDLKKRKISLDNVVFYPSCHEDTGTTWRFLKIDMSFLRIVIGRDKDAFKNIIDRLCSIMFARDKQTNEWKKDLN